jgi:predicted nucleic acid-binding protein
MEKREHEERNIEILSKKGSEIKKYSSHEVNDFISEEEIIGLDANLLADMVDSDEFKQEIRDRVTFNVLKIYTTNIALGEARHVLVNKKNYKFNEATAKLNEILKEFLIEKIEHQAEFNKLGNDWVNEVKKVMYIKKFSTFPNDCKILSNLIGQKKINVYFTEDKELKKAAEILGLKIRVRVIPEAGNLTKSKVKDFFFNQRSKAGNKPHRHH